MDDHALCMLDLRPDLAFVYCEGKAALPKRRAMGGGIAHYPFIIGSPNPIKTQDAT
jgi:hypothetical protein